MTDKELNAIAIESNAEIKSVRPQSKKPYNGRYRALCKIEKAFNDYYYKFNGELPCIRLAGVNDELI